MLMIRITRPFRIGAIATTALLGTTALAGAQQVPDKGREPSTREKGPDSKDLREPPGARQSPGIDQPKAGDRPGMDRPKGVERPDKDGPKGVERPDRDRGKGAERPDKDQPKGAERPDKDRPKGAERPDKDRGKGAERPDKDQPKGAERPDKDRPKGTERPDADRPKGAERPDADRPKGAERPDADRPKGAERPDKDGVKGAERPDQPKGARLSEQQRNEVGTKLRQTRIEKTRVQVNIAIGAPVPRSVRLHPLPSAVLVSAPHFRGHRYFVREDDTIVIVDSRSYVVVDVIPAATRAAGLTLSPEQMRFIYATVPKNGTVDVRLRLALGAEVPDHVELLPFPAEIRAQVPEVEGYRYIVTEREVAIVDPKDREIALVITE
jgi:hypothetical protein